MPVNIGVDKFPTSTLLSGQVEDFWNMLRNSRIKPRMVASEELQDVSGFVLEGGIRAGEAYSDRLLAETGLHTLCNTLRALRECGRDDPDARRGSCTPAA